MVFGGVTKKNSLNTPLFKAELIVHNLDQEQGKPRAITVEGISQDQANNEETNSEILHS